MDKDKQIQKIPEYSIVKLGEISDLAKRGLRDLGITITDDELLKKFNSLLHEFVNIPKDKEDALLKNIFEKTGVKFDSKKLNKLVNEIIALCKKILRGARLNSSQEYEIMFYYGYFLMRAKLYAEAAEMFEKCLSKHNQLRTGLREHGLYWTNDVCISSILGDCYLKIKNYDNALKGYNESIHFLTEHVNNPRLPEWNPIEGIVVNALKHAWADALRCILKWKGRAEAKKFIEGAKTFPIGVHPGSWRPNRPRSIKNLARPLPNLEANKKCILRPLSRCTII